MTTLLKQCILLLIATMLIPLSVDAYDVEVNGIYYNINDKDKTAEVTKGIWDVLSCWEGDRSYSGDITIPEQIEYNGINYIVNSIGKQAFLNRLYLKSVVLPNSIINIGEEAFQTCSQLTSITIPNKLEIIENRAFQGCSCLTSLIIPSFVSFIGKNTFWGCSGLNSIRVEKDNPIYDSREDCNAIIETQSNRILKGCINTVIPSTVTTIGEGAFYNCVNMASITIPEGVITIEKYAFENCSELTTMILPSTITSLGACVFINTSLTDLYLLSETPPQKDEGFFTGLHNCRINVPCGCLEAYGNARGWGSNGKLSAAPGNLLIYLIDDEEYLSIEVCCGKPIIPEAEPVKEGYTFSGWSNIPEIMPDEDVIVTGSFKINQYKLTYVVDGEEYKSYELGYATSIIPEADPIKEGYTFSGWSEIPESMPARDVTISGSFTLNQYVITYIIDGEEYLQEKVDYNSPITPPNVPEKDGYDFSWGEYPETMPAYDIKIIGTYTTGIKNISVRSEEVKIFTICGRQINKLQKGVNIFRIGQRTIKVMVK